MAEHPESAALTILVHDHPGVLAKIANLFYRRGLDIRTLTVTPSGIPSQSRLEVEVSGPGRDWARIGLAIGNLVDVVSVQMMTKE